MKTDVDVGLEIRDSVFQGNLFGQLSLIRKSLWALNVLRKEDSTEEDKLKAEEILAYAENVDLKIQEILDKYYIEE
jgi:hypothetical protein